MTTYASLRQSKVPKDEKIDEAEDEEVPSSTSGADPQVLTLDGFSGSAGGIMSKIKDDFKITDEDGNPIDDEDIKEKVLAKIMAAQVERSKLHP